MDKQTVAKVAKLARLKITDEEQAKYADQLGSIFGLIEQLNEVNTDNIEPMTSAIPHAGHWRKDEHNDGDDAARVLSNAPETAEGFFVVPKVIEGVE